MLSPSTLTVSTFAVSASTLTPVSPLTLVKSTPVMVALFAFTSTAVPLMFSAITPVTSALPVALTSRPLSTLVNSTVVTFTSLPVASIAVPFLTVSALTPVISTVPFSALAVIPLLTFVKLVFSILTLSATTSIAFPVALLMLTSVISALPVPSTLIPSSTPVKLTSLIVVFSPVTIIAVPVLLDTSTPVILTLSPVALIALSLALINSISDNSTLLPALNMLVSPLASIVWLLPLIVIPSGIVTPVVSSPSWYS